jgi:hypothetical protein
MVLPPSHSQAVRKSFSAFNHFSYALRRHPLRGKPADLPRADLSHLGYFLRENEKHMQREAEERLHADWEEKEALFYTASRFFHDHIPLFWEHRKQILREPRFYSAIAPHGFFDRYADFLTIGTYLELWQTEKVFTEKCKCGGKSFVCTSFKAHNIDEYHSIGDTRFMTAYCGVCGTSFNVHHYEFEARAALDRHPPRQPVAENPVTLKELVDILEGEE